MPDPTFTAEDLTTLLESVGVPRAGARTQSEVADAQITRLLTRISALTDALRAPSSNDTARLASRILLDDLGLVSAQFRGTANTMHASLEAALTDLRAVLSDIDKAG